MTLNCNHIHVMTYSVFVQCIVSLALSVVVLLSFACCVYVIYLSFCIKVINIVVL